jgi:hypothetical protein
MESNKPSSSESYIIMPVNSFNNDPSTKNYSNCDIIGSFYEIHTIKDISSNTIAK